MKKEELSIDNGNGKDSPPIMQVDGENSTIMFAVKSLKQEMNVSRQQTDLSKYVVMEGMQNSDKVDFFTEFIDFNDAIRMNTIERYIKIAPLIIRKSKKIDQVKAMMQEVYGEHVKEHKRNMTSLKRKREEAYTKILGADSSDSGVIAPTGLKRFFGVGRQK